MQCSKGVTLNREGSKEFKTLWTKALVADSTGNFTDAIRWYGKIVDANYYPRSTVNALTNRGRAKVALGDTLGGLTDLRKSTSILPTHPALISISLLQHDSDSSLYYLLRAKGVAPREPRVYFGLVGHYTFSSPKKDSALYYAELLLNLKPNIMMLDLLTTTYLQFPDPDQLIAVANQIIVLNPKDAYAYNNRGFAFFKKDEYNQAKKDIEKSLTLDVNNSYAYKNLGLVFLQTQKLDSACIQFTKAEELGFAANYGNEIDSLLKRHCIKK